MSKTQPDMGPTQNVTETRLQYLSNCEIFIEIGSSVQKLALVRKLGHFSLKLGKLCRCVTT